MKKATLVGSEKQIAWAKAIDVALETEAEARFWIDRR